MDLLAVIKNNQLTEFFTHGNFGLEKEGLRTVYPATLAPTRHPQSLENREQNPYIKTDYGEAQPELITPPLASYQKAHDWLSTLNYVLHFNLPSNEYIWPFSVPCRLPYDENDIRLSATSDPRLTEYRQYTAKKYGKKRQLINGIHINYSFSNRFLTALFTQQNTFTVPVVLADHLYLKLASNFLRYQWLLVYLFGATPIADNNFFDSPFFIGKKLPTEPMRSLRNSAFGFSNDPNVTLRYDSVIHYVLDLQAAVSCGKLRQEREYYGDVRLRGQVRDSSRLLVDGIKYLEIRSFDHDPFQPVGLSKETLCFIHLFLLTMVCLPDMAQPSETAAGEMITRRVASEHPYAQTAMYDEGLWLFDQLKKVQQTLDLGAEYEETLAHMFWCLDHPEATTSGKILTNLGQEPTLFKLGESLGQQHKAETLGILHLPGFEHLNYIQVIELVHLFETGTKIPTDYLSKTLDKGLLPS